MERRSHERRRSGAEGEGETVTQCFNGAPLSRAAKDDDILNKQNALISLQWSAALTSGEGEVAAGQRERVHDASMERRSHERRRVVKQPSYTRRMTASMERRSHERRRDDLIVCEPVRERRLQWSAGLTSGEGLHRFDRAHASGRFNGAPLSRAAKGQNSRATLARSSCFNGAPLSRAAKVGVAREQIPAKLASMERRSHERRRSCSWRKAAAGRRGFNGAPLSRAAKGPIARARRSTS